MTHKLLSLLILFNFSAVPAFAVRPVCTGFLSSHSNPYNLRITFSRNFVPKTMYISELADEAGNILLFRVIDRPYVPGMERHSKWVAEEGGVATSLSPHISEEWVLARDGRLADGDVLLFRQNIFADDLLYPHAETFTYASGLNRTDIISRPVDRFTEVGEIAHLNEIKVPFPKINVVARARLSQYRAIIRGLVSTSSDGMVTREEILGEVLRLHRQLDE